jgi:hypothetical protein
MKQGKLLLLEDLLKIFDKNSKNRVAHFSRNGINVNTNFQIRENMISLRIGA